jgi:hypothetical protein
MATSPVWWAIVPGRDGEPFEILESEAGDDGGVWQPYMEHKCVMQHFSSPKEATEKAEAYLASQET